MSRFYPVLLFILFLFAAANNALSQCTVTVIALDSICPGASYQLVSKVTGGAPTTFTWSSSAGGSFPNNDTITVTPPATNTTYTVQISGGGCNTTASKTVEFKPVPAAPNMNFAPNNVCSGTLISFNTTPVAGTTYTWVFGDSHTATGSGVTHPYYSYGAGTATYNPIVIAKGNNGCTNSFSKTVSVLQRPFAALDQVIGVDTVTFNGFITFYQCNNNGQSTIVFGFKNAANPSTGVNSTIIWGDGSPDFTSNTNWTAVNHTYGIGIYDLWYIVTNTTTGCADTAFYKVFYGSNAAGGIGNPGNTSICGPGIISFPVSGFKLNPPGTIYQILFNDSTPPILYTSPPPDTIPHLFTRSSCGITSSNGITPYFNAFAAYLLISNPCGTSSSSALPIYISLAPTAKFTISTGDTVCQNTNVTVTNTSLSGQIATGGSCNRSTVVLWDIQPATGWTINSGDIGSDSGSALINKWRPGTNTLNVSFNTLGTYTIRLVAANICGHPDTTYHTICVGTPPAPSFTLPTTTGCSVYSLNPNNTTATPNGCSVVNYTWNVVNTGFVCTADSLNNYGFGGGTNGNSKNPNFRFYNQGTYNISLRAQNACGTFTTATQSIIVKDKPDATLNIPPGVCAGQTIAPSATALPCAGTISGYAWTFQGGTPATGSGTNPGNISFAISGLHTITVGATNECGTTPLTGNVSIDTIPFADAGPNQSICSNNNVQIGTPALGTFTYSWTPTIGLSDPTAAQPSVFLSNAGNKPDTVKYFLTVSSTGSCTTTDSVLVIVAPGVTVNAGFPQNVCAGHAVTLNGSFGGATTSITWTSNNGGTFSDATSPTSTYTPSISSGQVVLTITSNQPSGSCPAATGTTTINVISPPVADPGKDDSVCGGTSLRLGGPNQFGYNYNWSPSTGLDFTFTSNPNLNIVNTTNSIAIYTYTLIVSATGCADTADVTISVFPTPVVDAGAPVTVCAGSTIHLTGTISGGATSAAWSSSDGNFNPPNALNTQFTPSIASGVAIVTLTSNDPAGPCTAAVSVVSENVNPLATITNPLSQTVCSGSPTQSVTLTSAINGATYTWSCSSPDGIIGFIPNDVTPVIPPQTLINPNPTPGTVNIMITPSANGCAGIPSTYTITVNPLPHVILPSIQTICDGSSFNTVTLSSDVPAITYTWTSTAEQFITGNTPTGNGDITPQLLHNSGMDTGLVVYTVVPMANNCTGIKADYAVIINPTPKVQFSPSPQTICSGQNTQLVNLTSTTPGVNITWSAVLPVGLTNAVVSGTFTIPVQTLTNTLADPLTIQYTAQATTSGAVCPGTPANYSITVRPIPEVAFKLSLTEGCTPLFVNCNPIIQKYGIPDSLVFDWGDGTNDNILYPNANAPIWNSLSHSFYNNTSQPVTYNVGMTAHNQCIDTTVIHTVHLLPNLINAFFIPSVTSGCEPLTVSFRDQSTGATSVSWCFDYDQANNICLRGGEVDTPGATHTYTYIGGVHTVALYVTNGFGCAHDTALQIINVSPAPVAAFSSDNNLCAGAPLNFIQQSTTPNGSFLSSFRWLFGDNDSSFLVSPTHVYTKPGLYTVCMEATSSFACTDTVCQDITILTTPTVDFTFTDTCINTPPIHFTNATTGATFYNWTFGDGNTSTDPNPDHNYLKDGSYFVKLVASTNTCTDSNFHEVVVYPRPNAGFGISAPYSCGIPSSIQLSNISTGATGFHWDIGNSTSSTYTDPVAVYQSPGNYIITLTASNAFKCIDTASRSIDIYPYPLIRGVNVLTAHGCQPLSVQFSINASNANSFVWDFGDGSVLSSTSPGASHIYRDTGTYSVLLRAYSFNDCGDTLFMADTIHVYINPTAGFDYTTTANLEPYNGTIQFTNQSVNASHYQWFFGDGEMTTDTNPAHLFPAIQKYDVMMIAISEHNCKDTAYQNIGIIHKTLFVPNAFAPDFSGTGTLVRIWLPVATGLASYHAQIYNKWGELLWESTALTPDLSPSEGWDGSYQGKMCPQDDYVWKIDASFVDGSRWGGMDIGNGKTRKNVGSVTLIR